MIRGRFMCLILAVGTQFIITAVIPGLYFKSNCAISADGITKANFETDELDLINGQQWNYVPGVSRNEDWLDIVYEGFKIVHQHDANNQDNPPVNEYGVYLTTSGNFSVSAQLRNIRGEAGLTLYANPPIIFDEQRYDAKEVRVTIKNDTFWAGINYGNSLGWKVSKSYLFNQQVVNEPLEDDRFFVSGSRELRHHIWYNSIGPNYIHEALTVAHQTDPDAELFINDYGLEAAGPRWDAMIKLATDLVKQGVPLTGIGFESHVDDFTTDKINFTVLQQHFRQLAQLGLKARISEMDVDPRAGKDLQAQQFTGGLKVCINALNCSSFTVWGVNDTYGAGNEITNRDKLIVYGGRLWDKKYRPIKAVGEMQQLLTRK